MTKILYLEHPEPDLGSTQLSLGLRQVLGDDNIVDFPYKHSLHGQEEHLQGIDMKDFLIDNPTIFPDGDKSKPAKLFDWIIPSKCREYHYNEIVELINNGTFGLILLTPRSVCIYYLKRLITDCKDRIPPVILCDFEDYHTIRFDVYKEFYPYIKLITKSNYLKEECLKIACPIYPLPLSSPIVDNPKYRFDDSNENKQIDIHARLGLTSSSRKEIIYSLLKINQQQHQQQQIFRFNLCLSLPEHPGTIVRNGYHVSGTGELTAICELDNSLPYDQYCKEIACAKISISMRGHGYCGNPNRHFEIPSYNTLMLCEITNSFYEYPFEDGKTCIFFDPNNKNDAYEKAIYWLKDENENERIKIAKAGNNLLKEHHTCKKRAERLLELAKIEGLI